MSGDDKMDLKKIETFNEKNDLEKTNKIVFEDYKSILNSNMNNEFFFKDLLVKCYEKKLIDDENLKRINYERIELLKVQLKYYTKDESSSVLEEDAEKILDEIDYTISIYLKELYEEDKRLKNLNKQNILLDKLKNEELSFMFQNGFKIIKKKREESRLLFLKVQNDKLKTDNLSYNDTIDRGIGIFFTTYNDFFTPQEAPCSIDYQLFIGDIGGDIGCVGIEYIEKYLKTLDLENEFCRNFNTQEISEVLNGYDRESEFLLINIFELIFINSIGRIICGKNLNNLNINESDRKNIYNKLKSFSYDDLEVYFVKCSETCIDMLNIQNKELKKYMNMAAADSVKHIYNCIKLNKLEKVFISFIDDLENQFIEYIDKPKLSNSKFRAITEKIRNSVETDNKIEIIKDNIESLQDIVDMLEADCLFESEYDEYFKTLSEIEFVLLFKHMKDFDLLNICEKEWQYKFKKYLSNLNIEKYNLIVKYSEKVKII